MDSEKRISMESQFKKRKINPPPRRVIPTSASVKEPFSKANDSAFSKANDSAMTTGNSPSINQARNHAVAQAQQEGCTANFRIFDSQFGNFLIPVIPTRAELSG